MSEITVLRALTIGALSRLTGVNVETIRYYERIGIMPRPPRSAGGHRAYDGDQLKRLSFIRRSRALGFSLAEIRALLDLVDTGAYSCGEVHAMTMAHLAEIRRKIADLRRLERVLKEVAAGCSRGDVPDCPIVDALYDDGPRGHDRRAPPRRVSPALPTLPD